MATQSSCLAWEIPWTEEPGELQSRRSQRVGRDSATEHSCMQKKKKLYESKGSSHKIMWEEAILDVGGITTFFEEVAFEQNRMNGER